jgi:hypothetical protein
VGEIVRVYLYSKAPLVPQQEEACLRDILEQARQGFRIELQREVFAHTAEETFVFLVKKIEPSNKFYGLVDKDTVFEIMHDEPKKPVGVMTPTLNVKQEESSELIFTEVGRLKPFIDELEALRNKYVISWECVHKLVEAIEQFGDETASRL